MSERLELAHALRTPLTSALLAAGAIERLGPLNVQLKRTPDGDFGFDPEFSAPSIEARMKHRLKNLALVESLLAMDRGVAPTAWQASRLPAEYQHRVDVIFDGIDTTHVRPDPSARFAHPQVPAELAAGDPVVTFVNRNLEPYRGYHVLMRALPEIQRRLPDAETRRLPIHAAHPRLRT